MTTAVKASARERLLAAADELFYREGVHTVGIDRIIEHAGVAKASLYNCFGSKEALVAAYLEGRQARSTGRIERAMAAHDDPRGKILAVFEAQQRLFADPEYRGCAFVAATAEAPAGGVEEQASDRFRTWLRELFVRLAGEAGVADPDSLGRTLHLLYDGAMTSARMDRDPQAAAVARDTAAALLDAAPKRKRSARR
ncbi:MAG: TetR/AcrR family transcriptional regulator [Jatrophihabitans sp.]|uniref:TetR/AcrR family transcriptional regulator n=1 Tax=Jatrophihabitans sp. TaxID=1932789 RepID=UPI003F7E7E59